MTKVSLIKENVYWDSRFQKMSPGPLWLSWCWSSSWEFTSDPQHEAERKLPWKSRGFLKLRIPPPVHTFKATVPNPSQTVPSNMANGSHSHSNYPCFSFVSVLTIQHNFPILTLLYHKFQILRYKLIQSLINLSLWEFCIYLPSPNAQ